MLTITLTKDFTKLALLNKDVQDLHVELYPKEFKPYNQNDIEQAFEQMLNDENAFAFIASEAGQDVGYLICFIKTRIENAFQFKKTFLYIDQICVVQNYREKGIAARLLERAEELAREKGITQIELDHWQDNMLATEFFGKKGFAYFKHMMKKAL